MNLICKLCGNEVKIKTKDPKEEKCPICHRNGIIDEEGVWEPTLVEINERKR